MALSDEIHHSTRREIPLYFSVDLMTYYASLR